MPARHLFHFAMPPDASDTASRSRDTSVTMMPMLVFADGQERLLVPGTIVRVGRTDDNDLVLDSGDVSRQHATVEALADGTVRVVDLGSTNGTRVNGAPVTETIVRPDELLSFGPSKTARIERRRIAMLASGEMRPLSVEAVAPVADGPVALDRWAVHEDRLVPVEALDTVARMQVKAGPRGEAIRTLVGRTAHNLSLDFPEAQQQILQSLDALSPGWRQARRAPASTPQADALQNVFSQMKSVAPTVSASPTGPVAPAASAAATPAPAAASTTQQRLLDLLDAVRTPEAPAHGEAARGAATPVEAPKPATPPAPAPRPGFRR